MPDQTPIYGLRFQELNDPPNGAKLGRELAFDVEDEISRVDSRIDGNDADIASLDSRVTTNEGDIAELKKGWNFIASGSETADFSIDFTAGGTFPAGTFNMLRVEMAVDLASGNSFVIGTINNLTGASDYNRAWWGKSFDDTTLRNTSNSSDNLVLGYISAQRGNSVEAIFHDTNVSSFVPMRSFSNRGAPGGFDGNREWMICNNSMEPTVLMDSLQVFATTGNVGRAEWYAEGFRL